VLSSETQVDSYALSRHRAGRGLHFIHCGHGHDRGTFGAIPCMSSASRRTSSPANWKLLTAENPLAELLTLLHTRATWRRARPISLRLAYHAAGRWRPPVLDYADWTPLTKRGVRLDPLHSRGLGDPGPGRQLCRHALWPPGFARQCDQNHWSAWTEPGFAPRLDQARAGRHQTRSPATTTDLSTTRPNTTASIISQAGHRWEGDVPSTSRRSTMRA